MQLRIESLFRPDNATTFSETFDLDVALGEGAVVCAVSASFGASAAAGTRIPLVEFFDLPELTGHRSEAVVNISASQARKAQFMFGAPWDFAGLSFLAGNELPRMVFDRKFRLVFSIQGALAGDAMDDIMVKVIRGPLEELISMMR